ncbi:serine hydrolase domain-containing protein [Portibacter lacus]|uniref:serine hydrolase domain-containing protein n=1 Tax=Portibacter lacus TaxID=1099794 RepID=UPI001F463943|nr:serine hydrolase domain-containing protein [Portibacter lacus]
MKKLFIIIIILSFNFTSFGQKKEKEIDEIFKEWNHKDHPGGVVSILKKGKTLFSKAYGLADIKHAAPHKLESVFNIASVSKQFTAMGIILLHIDGQLSIDDDIRKFLPELHEFETPISLRHLLHHTSGLRSTPELFGLAGWRDGDPITTEDDWRYLLKQTNLNFKPNSQFMYSNSGYILLAKIIERVSGKHFHAWMKEEIFIPLELNQTFVDETNSNAGQNVATPYLEMGEGQFAVGENTSLDIGASNIYTTASDLSKWMENFRDPADGWKDAFEMLLTMDVLDDGQSNNYGFGVVVDDFFGNNRIQHTGGVPGFLSFAMYYPDDELTIVLLTNFVSFSVNDKLSKLTQLYLKNKTRKSSKKESVKTIAFDVEEAQKWIGDYWNINENYPRNIYLDQDTLWYLRDNGMKSPLFRIGLDEYLMGGIAAVVKVKFANNGKNDMQVFDRDRPVQSFIAFDNVPVTIEEQKEYAGNYYSPELETNYIISFQNSELVGYHIRHGEFPIAILKKDVTDWSGFAIVTYERDEQDEIIGFYASINRVKKVWFAKRKD